MFPSLGKQQHIINMCSNPNNATEYRPQLSRLESELQVRSQLYIIFNTMEIHVSAHRCCPFLLYNSRVVAIDFGTDKQSATSSRLSRIASLSFSALLFYLFGINKELISWEVHYTQTGRFHM